MGEMADFALEEVENYEDLRWQYTHGEIEDDEAYEYGIIDEFGGIGE